LERVEHLLPLDTVKVPVALVITQYLALYQPLLAVVAAQILELEHQAVQVAEAWMEVAAVAPERLDKVMLEEQVHLPLTMDQVAVAELVRPELMELQVLAVMVVLV
jgi:hypothetical protein